MWEEITTALEFLWEIASLKERPWPRRLQIRLIKYINNDDISVFIAKLRGRGAKRSEQQFCLARTHKLNCGVCCVVRSLSPNYLRPRLLRVCLVE